MTSLAATLLSLACLASSATAQLSSTSAPGFAAPSISTAAPYKGPAVPVGDFYGNFVKVVEPPAVAAASNATNSVNVVALSYVPTGMNIHYSTPFSLAASPKIMWGNSSSSLVNTAYGSSRTYGRTPACNKTMLTMCNEFFHDVQITGLSSGATYYYSIPADASGTTASPTLQFTTARVAGDPTPYNVSIICDMGYTNAQGTYAQLLNKLSGTTFVWHGGDIAYADDWYSGILPCASDWPVCWAGTPGEPANQGGPYGGDSSTVLETNWDIWTQWMNNVTMKVPYMVLPGNHEASCAEFDDVPNYTTSLLDEDLVNVTSPVANLTYYSCPPSQRNFTAYQARFRMPGPESKGQTNFWYSFDQGLVHYISLDAETDIPSSPEYTFAEEATSHKTSLQGLPPGLTDSLDSGPFGTIGNSSDFTTYAQYQWLVNDLASIDRTKTPWVIAMSHRAMYTNGVSPAPTGKPSSYEWSTRTAFEPLLNKYGVDAYIAGHIHWYERLVPFYNGTADYSAVVNNNTYISNGRSMTHFVNGQAGNIEDHSTLYATESLGPYTGYFDQTNYGMMQLAVYNATTIRFAFISGTNGAELDHVYLLKSNTTRQL